MAIIEKAPQRHGDGARKRCDHIALGLLAAAMLLACVACDISVDEVGAIGVCSIESGELLTHGVYAIFLSNDSGFTWVWEGGIEHCLGSSNAQSAETPRGIYTIEGTDIVRAFDGKREIAYSAVVFSERTDYIVVEAATNALGGKEDSHRAAGHPLRRKKRQCNSGYGAARRCGRNARGQLDACRRGPIPAL